MSTKIHRQSSSHVRYRWSTGITVIEMIIVLTIIAMFLTLTTVNFSNLVPKAQLSGTQDTLMADLKTQQARAMSGDTDGLTSPQQFGVHIDQNRYVLFTGSSYATASASNTFITVPPIQSLSTTFPSGNIIFQQGSGDIVGYASGSATIFITDQNTSAQKNLILNRYGVVTQAQ